MNVLMSLILICLILITSILFVMQIEIKKLNEKISNNTKIKSQSKAKRKHNSINPVNYSSPIQARKNPYENYKNDKGLYEPRSPKRGIEIKEG